MKNFKTFYSVEYTSCGTFGIHTAYFDNKEEAYEFANHDYRDKPVAHTVSNPSAIKNLKDL